MSSSPLLIPLIEFLFLIADEIDVHDSSIEVCNFINPLLKVPLEPRSYN
ncbi:Uncharacterised protein [Orientia tsutsugamushi]|uniref:Uncharacterized protein n=1 Tax=Orientia tsutsugamushi TaxID=784 RepID=A0A2U3QSK5_ORITS|nr:Uncharacterised protein [Orientia tsutsugamushi]